MSLLHELCEYGRLDVLIIDDQAAVRDMLQGFLFKIGVRTVVEAKDGEEAIGLMDAFTPTLILCDIDMKPMNGFEFLHTLRSSPLPARDAPVVMLTSHTDEVFVTAAKAFQVEGYLIKPVNGPRLKALIDKVLAERPKSGGLDRLRQFLATSDAGQEG